MYVATQPPTLAAVDIISGPSHLEEVPHPMMPAIEGPSIPGEQRAHGAGERTIPRPHQEMRMVREERPGGDRPGPGLDQGGQASDEVGAVLVIPKEGGPFNAPHHDVLEGSGGIETRLAGHGRADATISRQSSAWHSAIRSSA